MGTVSNLFLLHSLSLRNSLTIDQQRDLDLEALLATLLIWWALSDKYLRGIVLTCLLIRRRGFKSFSQAASTPSLENQSYLPR